MDIRTIRSVSPQPMSPFDQDPHGYQHHHAHHMSRPASPTAILIAAPSASMWSDWNAPRVMGCSRITCTVIFLVILILLLARLPKKNPRAALVTSLITLVYLWVSVGTVATRCFDPEFSTVSVRKILLLFLPILFLYGMVYTCFVFWDKDAFKGAIGALKDPTNSSNGTGGTFADMTYFSAANMTTLSYGDIVPKGRFPRAIVVTQFVLSFILIAILVTKMLK